MFVGGACKGKKMELFKLNELQNKWLTLDEAVKKAIEDIRSENSESNQFQKFENLKKTLEQHDRARKAYFDAAIDWASRMNN